MAVQQSADKTLIIHNNIKFQAGLQAVEELLLTQTQEIKARTEALDRQFSNKKMTDCFYCRDKLPPDPSEVWYEDSGGVRRQFCANLCKQMFETDNKA